jgi:two-component system nitrate/nitrite response regulator NarL
MIPREKLCSDFINVVVADTTRIHTELLADALRNDRRIHVVGEASNSEEFLAAITRVPVDVVVISQSFNNQRGYGTRLLREMRSLRPQIRGVILLDSSDPGDVLECFRAGAKGIFSKQERLECLSKCIYSVYRGQIWAHSVDLDLALEALSNAPALCPTNHKGIEILSLRERQVVQQLAAGLSNREIAHSLGLSAHTVKNYLFRIFDKLGVSSRTELLFLAMNGTPAQPIPALKKGDGFSAVLEAAEAGSPSAQLRLAEHFSNIEDVQNIHDPSARSATVSAYSWYLLADEAATSMLHRIEAGKENMRLEMSPQQLAEAEERATVWLRNRKKLTTLATHNGETNKDDKGETYQAIA